MKELIDEINETKSLLTKLNNDILRYTKIKEIVLDKLVEQSKELNYFPFVLDNIDGAIEYLNGKTNEPISYNNVQSFLKEHFNSERIVEIVNYVDDYNLYAYGIRFVSFGNTFEFFLPTKNITRNNIGVDKANFGKLTLFVEEKKSCLSEIVSSYDIKDLEEEYQNYIFSEYDFDIN